MLFYHIDSCCTWLLSQLWLTRVNKLYPNMLGYYWESDANNCPEKMSSLNQFYEGVCKISTYWVNIGPSLVSEVKASASNVGDLGSIPGLGRSPGEGNGNPLQYSCLENPMDKGAWQSAVRGVTKTWTRLKWLSMYTSCKYEALNQYICSKSKAQWPSTSKV